MPFYRRSVSYLPASNERALAKGPALAADTIVIDLEDSISPENKWMARKQVMNALKQIVQACSLPENSGSGAITVNDRVTERLDPAMAEQLLQRVQRLSQRS